MPTPKNIPPTLLMLQTRFPEVFKKPCCPLAVGIKHEIRALIPAEEVSSSKLNQSLAFYCGGMAYLKALLAEDAQRIHLDGTPAGAVDEDAKRFARERLEAIEAKRKAAQAARPPKPVKSAPKAQPVKKTASAEKLALLQGRFSA